MIEEREFSLGTVKVNFAINEDSQYCCVSNHAKKKHKHFLPNSREGVSNSDNRMSYENALGAYHRYFRNVLCIASILTESTVYIGFHTKAAYSSLRISKTDSY